MVFYLLQNAPGPHVVGPDGHLHGQDILEVPHEVGRIRVGPNDVHKCVVSRQQAGDDGKLAPVVLLHELAVKFAMNKMSELH